MNNPIFRKRMNRKMFLFFLTFVFFYQFLSVGRDKSSVNSGSGDSSPRIDWNHITSVSSDLSPVEGPLNVIRKRLLDYTLKVISAKGQTMVN